MTKEEDDGISVTMDPQEGVCLGGTTLVEVILVKCFNAPRLVLYSIDLVLLDGCEILLFFVLPEGFDQLALVEHFTPVECNIEIDRLSREYYYADHMNAIFGVYTELDEFLNEIDRLSKEYYYADHMNAILVVYTTLDEFTDLQCDYLEQVIKCEHLEKELLKCKTMSKSFEALQKHAINLELALQQCKEQIKNENAFKENQSNVFVKEREQYFEIQDLKAQLQDKGIAITELKKLIEKLKGKSVETKFEKSSVIVGN
nr:hypothetical protein [Tanacetum cinerariifolium]